LLKGAETGNKQGKARTGHQRGALSAGEASCQPFFCDAPQLNTKKKCILGNKI
jgi:hypothetical protein